MSSNNDFKKDFDSSMGKVAKIFHEELDNLQNSEGIIFPKRIKGEIQLYGAITENTAPDGLGKIHNKTMITYNKENKSYSIGQCFQTLFEFCQEDLEEINCAQFVGSMGPATEDENEFESLGDYKKVVNAQIAALNHMGEMLEWVDKTFTNVVTHADFYPCGGDYNTYIEIPTDQFLEYCKTHNLPIPE